VSHCVAPLLIKPHIPHIFMFPRSMKVALIVAEQKDNGCDVGQCRA